MKRVLAFLCLFILLFSFTVSAESSNYNINTPYYSYTYDSSNTPVITPAPYTVENVFYGHDFGIDDFTTLSDVYFDREEENIYFTDSGTNRIIVSDKNYKLIHKIDSFTNNGQNDELKSPSSVSVRNGILYVADTGNQRILCFDNKNFDFIKELKKPEISVLSEDYTYSPAHIAVDMAGRIYVIASGINEGVLLLDKDGSFVHFAAAPDVVPSLWTKFLKMFMTKAQKENLEKAVPTEYNSILIDDEGFLYLTSSDSTVNPITKLNSQGKDVLKYDDIYPNGDMRYYFKNSSKATSTFVDIALNDDEIYAALDTENCRVFLYDQEGNLLYCFGSKGIQNGTFYSPSSIEMFGDTLIVTDSFYGSISVFRQTEFGKSVNSAINYMLDGDYENSDSYWNEVLKYCPNYDFAYINLARADIQNKKYGEALKKLVGTVNIKYYSKAFKGMRESLFRNYFKPMLCGLGLVIAVIALLIYLNKKYHWSEKAEKHSLIREYRYSNYCMFHPFDGFWDLKREKRGSFAAANLLMVAFIILYALRSQFTGYIFLGKRPEEVNTVFEIITIILPLMLWCVSNWCFTTLMDGEGTIKDIYIATSYALRPYIISAVPLLILSNCLSQDEAFIYSAFNSIIWIWTLALIFFGMMVTHDYSFSKALIALVLSLIGICLVMFIGLVFTDTLQQIYDFGADVYREFAYRLY